MYYRNNLDYALNSLEPFISRDTMDVHYNTLFKKYTDGLNSEIHTEICVKEILKNYKSYPTSVRNNAGGYNNHFLYFENLSPYYYDYSTHSSNDLKSIINANFQSYENFYKVFKDMGIKVFGSGWVWLIEKNNSLMVVTTSNQDNPLMAYDCNILLAMDVWEHSYFLDTKANREKYIENFFNVINWKKVSERLYDY
jgi:superoxide dismutase, Fe-Mn family